MKKLSKVELDVVVNKVVNSINLIEVNKCNEIFDKNESKELFLNKIKEIEEVENKLDELKKNIKEVEDKFKEDNLRVYYNSKGSRGYGGSGKLYSISLLEGKNNNYSLYKEIEKDIILKGIDEELNVKEFINGLIEKFK